MVSQIRLIPVGYDTLLPTRVRLSQGILQFLAFSVKHDFYVAVHGNTNDAAIDLVNLLKKYMSVFLFKKK